MKLASYWYVLCAYAHALTIARTNSMCQNFHCAKKFAEKFFTNQHALTKLAKVISMHTHTLIATWRAMLETALSSQMAHNLKTVGKKVLLCQRMKMSIKTSQYKCFSCLIWTWVTCRSPLKLHHAGQPCLWTAVGYKI